MERQEAERDAFLETLASFHVDPEHGQYDCIGYSEGQECCVEKLRTLLAEPVAKEEPSLEEVQRRGYRYGPGEPIPGDAVDTARERETPWFAELVQPRVNGKPFRCACGSSVFRHRAQPFGGVIGYACNACGAHYEGSSGG